MSDKNKPAFPATIEGGYVVMDEHGKPAQMTTYTTGMTLREYYAGLAMQGVLSNDALLNRVGDDMGDGTAQRFCVWWADALIAELQREDNDEAICD